MIACINTQSQVEDFFKAFHVKVIPFHYVFTDGLVSNAVYYSCFIELTSLEDLLAFEAYFKGIYYWGLILNYDGHEGNKKYGNFKSQLNDGTIQCVEESDKQRILDLLDQSDFTLYIYDSYIE